MRYIYDQIITDDDLTFEFWETIYYRSGKNHMENVVYYSFQHEGAEPLIIVPSFAEQFLEAAQKFKKLEKVTSRKAALIRIKTLYDCKPEELEFENGDSTEYKYTVQYKDIEIYMDMINEKLTLEPKFRIITRNILGYKVTVSVADNPELAQYCSEPEI